MILSIAVILLVGIIAYFNFSQGFFSATLSAFAAVLAAVLAVSYNEPLARLMFHGTGADVGNALTLCLLFVAGYGLLRVLFDKAVPGNVRVPATVNAIGGGIMGLVAGAYCIGTFVIAAQMMPFGPSILGYARYKLTDSHPVILASTGNNRSEDAAVNDQMESATLDRDKQVTLWTPVDDLVIGTAARLSAGGSLAGSTPLTSVHPDWLSELFGERIGIQPGTRHAALVSPTSDPVSVTGIYTAAVYPAVDGYGKVKKGDSVTEQIRPEGYKARETVPDKADKAAGLVPMVVRVKLKSRVTDDPDTVFRFSPGSVRLVLRKDLGNGEFGPGTDYYPVGMLEDGKTVVTNRVDDFLFASLGTGDAGFDAVFLVDPSAFTGPRGKQTVAPGTFLTVKRLDTVDLSGMTVTVGDTVPLDANQNLMRTDVMKLELHPPEDGHH